MPPSALFYLYSFRNGKRLRRIFRIWLLEKWNLILNSMEAWRWSWWRTGWIPLKFGIGNAILPFSKAGQAFLMISIKSWTHRMSLKASADWKCNFETGSEKNLQLRFGGPSLWSCYRDYKSCRPDECRSDSSQRRLNKILRVIFNMYLYYFG